MIAVEVLQSGAPDATGHLYCKLAIPSRYSSFRTTSSYRRDVVDVWLLYHRSHRLRN
jgi:hypothetical protein